LGYWGLKIEQVDPARLSKARIGAGHSRLLSLKAARICDDIPDLAHQWWCNAASAEDRCMLFIPYKFDLSLSKVPYLTILVCIVCIGVYTQQYLNEVEFEKKSLNYCAANLSSVERMAMEKTFSDSSPNACLALMFELELSDEPEKVIKDYAAESAKFAGFSEADSKIYIEEFLLDRYHGYERSVPAYQTKALWYVPDSWNPATMVTSTFSHGSWDHLIGNLIFFFAFAAAVELIIGSLAFLGVIIAMAFGTNIAYSLAMMSVESPLPTVGLSGIVMGMIAMLTYFLPTAKIRCFYWFLIKIGTMAVSAWILALIYIGIDVYTLVSQEEMGGVNLVAHVSGAMLGFLLGATLFRKQKRQIAFD
jgi:membrane associated rhomboid family serine protease